jgi:4-hydroxy-tetrahydrodipicolinate synthase
MTAKLISAPTTPFAVDGEVDLEAARKLYVYLEPYVDAVFVTGTMGEFPALSASERLNLFQVALEVFGPRRVIAHVGTGSSRNTMSLAAGAAAIGVERLAVITPYFMPVTTDEVVDYIERVTGSVEGEWFGYLFPERTGVALSPDETARIVAAGNVAGLKISGADTARLADYIAACPPSVEIYSGNDAAFPETVAAGGAGVVSGFSSAFPLTFRRLADALNDGDAAGIEAAQSDVLRVTAVLNGRVGAAKVVQSLRGLGEGHARMTVQLPDERSTEEIAALVDVYG